MKNQYFADINDYKKYGLLRTLVGESEIKVALCWMLTPNDEGSDGKFRNYLEKPEKWNKYDPSLFDLLASGLADESSRSVQWAEANHLIPSAVYFSKTLSGKSEERQQYFAEFRAIAEGCDLAFFDPDNGIEVTSVPYGHKDSSKYIYWSELKSAFATGQSILVYQHFIRVKRVFFIQKLVNDFRKKLNISTVFSFSIAHVVFFLIPQPHHQEYFTRKYSQVSKRWCTQIKASKHPCSTDELLKNNR